VSFMLPCENIHVYPGTPIIDAFTAVSTGCCQYFGFKIENTYRSPDFFYWSTAASMVSSSPCRYGKLQTFISESKASAALTTP